VLLLWSALLDDYVWFVFWVLGGEGLLAGWNYDRVTLFDKAGSRLWAKFLRGCTPSPSISPNGEFLAGFEDVMLYFYNLRSGEERYRVRVPGYRVTSVSWISGGEYFVVGQASGYVTLYKLSGGMVEEEWAKKVVDGVAVEFTSPLPQPYGKILLNGSNPYMYLMNLKGDVIWKHRLDSTVRGAAFSPKEDCVAVITKNSFYILDLDEGGEVARSTVKPAHDSMVWMENCITIGMARLRKLFITHRARKPEVLITE